MNKKEVVIYLASVAIILAVMTFSIIVDGFKKEEINETPKYETYVKEAEKSNDKSTDEKQMEEPPEKQLVVNEESETIISNSKKSKGVDIEKIVNVYEMDLLAHLIYAEVGCIEDEECWYACGSVVLNRVAAEDFPDTIEGVIYQTIPSIQYACTIDGGIEKEATDRAYEIAADLLVGGSRLPENVIFQAEFIQGSGVYAKYENTFFCCR